MLTTPHHAWAPIISKDYDERSQLFMWREIMSTVTLLVLLLLPVILSNVMHMDRRGQIAVMSAILIVSLPLTVGLRFGNSPIPMAQSRGKLGEYQL